MNGFLVTRIPEDAVEIFLKERGFKRGKDVSADDLKSPPLRVKTPERQRLRDMEF